MMFHFPFFNMPYYNRYSRYGYRYPYYGRLNPISNANATTYSNSNTNESFSKYGSFNKNLKKDAYNNSNSKDATSVDSNNNNNNNESNLNADGDSPLFQLFGINLYFDDILLICLIWFLYDEGVKDEGLFMALILLLLS